MQSYCTDMAPELYAGAARTAEQHLHEQLEEVLGEKHPVAGSSGKDPTWIQGMQEPVMPCLQQGIFADDFAGRSPE